MCRSPVAKPRTGAGYLCYFVRGLKQRHVVGGVQPFTQARNVTRLGCHLPGLGWEKHQVKRRVTFTGTQPSAPAIEKGGPGVGAAKARNSVQRDVTGMALGGRKRPQHRGMLLPEAQARTHFQPVSFWGQ